MKLILILNDQGGAEIRCETKEISPTLRAQDHGHPPLVLMDSAPNIRQRQEESDGRKSAAQPFGGGVTPAIVIYEADNAD